MTTLEYITDKYQVNLDQRMPIKIKKSRWSEYPALLKELGFKIGAEVGVQSGRFTRELCKKGLKIYGIDKWITYEGYNDFREQEKLDQFEKKARERVAGFDCQILKEWSSDIVNDFEDESLDFVFIDGNHALEYVIEDVAKWSKKVKKGGIVSGHDYFRGKGRNKMHVKDAINTWAYCYKVNPWFVFTNDKGPTWFWIK